MKSAAPLFALALTLAALPAAATTFVMVSDDDLVDHAALVVEARVLSQEPAPTAGMPSTDYLIEVERVVKGDLPGSNLVVRVPGGERPDGVGLRIWGAPSFRPEERVLLFLIPREDGTYRVMHLMLGAFHEAELRGETVLVRNLAEANELSMPGEAAGARDRYRGPRARAGFLDWAADRAQGITRQQDYMVQADAGELGQISDAFTLFESNGLNLRWFTFDNGGTERWQIYQSGQPGLTVNQTIDALGAGLAAWNADPGTDINYGFVTPRTTTASGGLTNSDGKNVLLFDDPNNDSDFGGVFTCPGGGVLAIGGPWFARGAQTWEGRQFLRIQEADIVTNKGIECYLARGNAQKSAEQLYAHELGHTLGLGHSCGDGSSPACSSNALADDALMRAFIHEDNRGARLNDDDRAAVRELYGNGVVVGGEAPLPPSNLTATLSTPTSALLAWQDNSGDETGFRIQQSTNGGTFTTLTNLAANVESYTVNGLSPSTTYAWRVRALGASANSAFSNEAGVTTPAPIPAAPANLIAVAISPTVVQLVWDDSSSGETGFVIERSSPQAVFAEVGITGANATGFLAAGLTPGSPYSFRVRARNANGTSAASNEASATPQSNPTATCVAGPDTLCLLNNRFRARVHWRNQFAAGDNGMGQVQTPPTGGGKTGVLSFFNPDNIELIVKSLDGRPVNGSQWFFYGALSTVEYWITVTDTETGVSNTYHNPPGELCGFPDTEAFPENPLDSPAASVQPARRSSALRAITAAASTDPCLPGTETLCLADGRFEVRVDWTDQRTLDTGEGKAVTSGNEKTGYFWFFNPANIELVVKVLDARTISGNWWIFYGSLSDVAYTLTVRDTVTGLEKSYVNDPGNFCGQADTEGLPDELVE